ncbi:VCBS repeat-containing protein [archaeon]|nr:VCBS repeat-containing protein [archaeon]
MNFVTKTLLSVGFMASLVGCDRYESSYQAKVDLNGDGVEDVVDGRFRDSYDGFRDYSLIASLSNSEGSFDDPVVLARLSKKPTKVEFADFDNDGDIDLSLKVPGEKIWGNMEYNKFLSKNDGEGNFGPLELDLSWYTPRF